jgi:hypothetical protein
MPTLIQKLTQGAALVHPEDVIPPGEQISPGEQK